MVVRRLGPVLLVLDRLVGRGAEDVPAGTRVAWTSESYRDAVACRGARVHRAFWRNDEARWRILAYQGSGDCSQAHGAARAFPTEVRTS